MRITTGMVGGRELFVPKSAVRPTQDKVRQAMFSSLGEGVVGCRFLDLFAGSGAVGLEAWSRGASFVELVENEARAVETIHRNIGSLGVPKESVQVLKMDVGRFLERPLVPQPFDIIFADPPYQKSAGGGRRTEDGGRRTEDGGRRTEDGGRRTKHPAAAEGPWLEKVLSGIGAHSILQPRGILIFEQGDDEAARTAAGWEIIQERRYGAARLVFYRMLKPEC